MLHLMSSKRVRIVGPEWIGNSAVESEWGCSIVIKPQSAEEVNNPLVKAGKRTRVRLGPSTVKPGLYFVRVGQNERAYKIDRASCVSDLTMEEWIEELKFAEAFVKIDHR